jgi:hypothetical protein
MLYNAGIANELFPLILFIGIGAMIDFDYGQEYARRIPRNRHNYTRYYSPKQIHRPEEVNATKRFL